MDAVARAAASRAAGARQACQVTRSREELPTITEAHLREGAGRYCEGIERHGVPREGDEFGGGLREIARRMMGSRPGG